MAKVELRDFLQSILSEVQKDWRQMRKEEKRKKVTEKIHIDISEWYDKLPEDIQPKIESIVDSIDRSELTAEEESNTVKKLHALIPEYPYYHWRHLHPEIQESSKNDYQSEDYYRAFVESAKRYINSVRDKSGSSNTSERSMMGEVFGDNSILTVTQKYQRPSGEDFPGHIKNDIEEGQKFLSMGIVSGGRNPLSHEEIANLKESELVTEKDCLDLLSILSHLFKRLDDAVKNST